MSGFISFAASVFTSHCPSECDFAAASSFDTHMSSDAADGAERMIALPFGVYTMIRSAHIRSSSWVSTIAFDPALAASSAARSSAVTCGSAPAVGGWRAENCAELRGGVGGGRRAACGAPRPSSQR